MAARRSRRLLAPIALAACTIAVGLIVITSLSGGDPAPTGAQPAAQQSGGSTTASSSTPARRTYTVRSGDTLSLIAEKTGVTVQELVRLNEGVDPQSLRTGQKLRLREP